MDIKITYNTLKKFLETESGAEKIAQIVSLCGPTFDRTHKIDEDYLFEIEAITKRHTVLAFRFRQICAQLIQYGERCRRLRAKPGHAIWTVGPKTHLSD